MIDKADQATLYGQHLSEKTHRFQAILGATEFDEIVIAAGDSKIQFADDMAYPFVANPYFREWVPLGKRVGSYLQISLNSDRPRLFLLTVEDIWHTAPQSLPAGFEQGLEIVEYASLDELKKYLSQKQDGTAFIAETNSLNMVQECWNPQAVTDQIDYERRAKTAYEQDCVRQANRLAVPAHRAAYKAFMTGASELEIAAAYLRGCDCSEHEMPYGIIAGVNEHGAVLHHHNLDKQRRTPRSFLIDAGVAVNGYASDITRTYAYDPGSDFAALIEAMDVMQQQLVVGGGIGKSPVDLHVLSHLKVAEVLRQFDVLKVSAEEAFDLGISATFYPHGLGHHLGCNVHDRGSNLANAQGDLLPAPEKYPKLRSGALMVANQIHTVEPGLYFIPALLHRLREGEFASKINWSRVEDFLPFGGIRIEDNIVVHRDGSLENLTRDAFRDIKQ
jgi:Xaa-Pro dipeptidase